jgi:hypothetical protein
VVLAGIVHVVSGATPATDPTDWSPSIGVGGGQPIEIQTKVYDVLQAAVTVIWCISMVVLFVDVVIIIRRFLPRYEETTWRVRRCSIPAR